MAFKQSPNLVASGAMGIVTGLAIAGGLLFALSLPAMAEGGRGAESPAPSAQQASTRSHANQDLQRAMRSRADAEALRTFGNSTARSQGLNAPAASPQRLVNYQGGELVALSHPTLAMSGPRS